MTQYNLVVQNKSGSEGDICVYQTLPDLANPKVMSLAWFAEHAHPTTNVKFQWGIDYSFTWDETGVLKPGIIYDASQSWAADLVSQNQVTLAYRNGAFTFQNQQPGPGEGSLYITEDRSIPKGMASVGIGMSGSGTFAVQAEPNINLTFTPHPVYWVTFGTYISGQVLDVTQITNAAPISFPPNVYTVTAVLNPDNTWTVTAGN